MEGFNIYKEGIDLQLVIDACQKRGKVRHLKKGEIFEHEGEPAQWIGYIKSG